jgi:hypothetical protein
MTLPSYELPLVLPQQNLLYLLCGLEVNSVHLHGHGMLRPKRLSTKVLGLLVVLEGDGVLLQVLVLDSYVVQGANQYIETVVGLSILGQSLVSHFLGAY